MRDVSFSVWATGNFSCLLLLPPPPPPHLAPPPAQTWVKTQRQGRVSCSSRKPQLCSCCHGSRAGYTACFATPCLCCHVQHSRTAAHCAPGRCHRGADTCAPAPTALHTGTWIPTKPEYPPTTPDPAHIPVCLSARQTAHALTMLPGVVGCWWQGSNALAPECSPWCQAEAEVGEGWMPGCKRVDPPAVTAKGKDLQHSSLPPVPYRCRGPLRGSGEGTSPAWRRPAAILLPASQPPSRGNAHAPVPGLRTPLLARFP